MQFPHRCGIPFPPQEVRVSTLHAGVRTPQWNNPKSASLALSVHRKWLGRKNTMRKRMLGDTGLEVPVITLGGNVFGWTVGESDAFELLDHAVDLGLNFIDTADMYARWVPGNRGGESET